MAQNPFKQGYTVVKRVINIEGETAEFWSSKEQRMIKVKVPPGHVWVEGDNKENSKDSRDWGPLSLALVDGIIRYRIFPFNKAKHIGLEPTNNF